MAAAFKIGLTQPALSSTLQKLEDELGAKLFHRSRKGIRLTEAGTSLYQELKQIRMRLREGVAQSLEHKTQKLLRIGCVGHLASRFFLDVLKRVKPSLPIVHLYTATSLDCYERVIEGDLEFAFVAWSSPPRRLDHIRIAKEPVEFVGLKSAFPDLPKVKTFRDLKNFHGLIFPNHNEIGVPSSIQIDPDILRAMCASFAILSYGGLRSVISK